MCIKNNIILSFSLQTVIVSFLSSLILFGSVTYYAFCSFKAELNSVNLLITTIKLENALFLEKLNLENSLQAAKILSLEKAIASTPTIHTVAVSQPILDVEIIKFIEDIVSRTKPSVVLTHFGGDLNVDHRVVNQAVITACRPTSDQCVKKILFFEVPSSTEWQIPSNEEAFIPNWFEDISESLDVKIKALEQYAFELRDWPHPRSVKGVKHLAHWRGASCGVNAAEAFILGRRTP
jgi:LmbE family N-acetylglucosaminyl deacetylase